ncbi:MAG: prephenate dehydratase [Anaerolineae bacterium]|nr:prephenate dehydratase [Anaerolineales bacterium]MCQ3972868.1 prephenate dehydratase [Anaerolineae bacterium]
MTSLRVAFQGERGAYSEAAAVAFFGDSVQPIPYNDFDSVFEAVNTGQVDRGVLPVENSLAGSIHRNYDLLLRYELFIVGEVQIRIAHQLIALPGVSLNDIKKIYSHPQALAQCEQSITRLFPYVERVVTYDTAGSVKMIKEQNIRDGAGLASQRAAAIYGMDILQPDMQDDAENYTRFVVVAREPEIPAGEAKTSIVFSMDNMPGSLFKSLAVFALRDIDLTKIESRPLQGKRWQYFFYIDFIASQYEERGRNALNHLREITSYLKVLGSYPRGV